MLISSILLWSAAGMLWCATHEVDTIELRETPIWKVYLAVFMLGPIFWLILAGCYLAALIDPE